MQGCVSGEGVWDARRWAESGMSSEDERPAVPHRPARPCPPSVVPSMTILPTCRSASPHRLHSRHSLLPPYLQFQLLPPFWNILTAHKLLSHFPLRDTFLDLPLLRLPSFSFSSFNTETSPKNSLLVATPQLPFYPHLVPAQSSFWWNLQCSPSSWQRHLAGALLPSDIPEPSLLPKTPVRWLLGHHIVLYFLSPHLLVSFAAPPPHPFLTLPASILEHSRA